MSLPSPFPLNSSLDEFVIGDGAGVKFSNMILVSQSDQLLT